MDPSFTHTLERLEETEKSGHLRTSGVVKGFFDNPPEIGKRFSFFGKGVVAGTRWIYTSIVEEITDNGFITQSGSVYKLQPIR